MKIITISREFGSGGREIGKRLADILGFEYYDREIISEIAKIGNFDEKYVEHMGEGGFVSSVHLTYGRTLYYPQAQWDNSTKLLIAEQKALNSIVQRGKDCIIVGRCADVVLSEYKPFNLFIYADMESKIERCKKRMEDERFITESRLAKQIKRIDKNRAKHREAISHIKWGRKEAYHLCVNTTGINPKDITPVIADYATSYFKNIHK